jgi:hypothetical protein
MTDQHRSPPWFRPMCSANWLNLPQSPYPLRYKRNPKLPSYKIHIDWAPRPRTKFPWEEEG